MTNDNSLLDLQVFSLANINKLILNNVTLMNWSNSTDLVENELFFNSQQYMDYIVKCFQKKNHKKQIFH